MAAHLVNDTRDDDTGTVHSAIFSSIVQGFSAIALAAIARERTVMSRELHDIAAHHLSGIAMLAAAMKKPVSKDPDAAIESARSIRAQSVSVLDDLRQLVGLLRDDSSATTALETLAAIGDIVAQRRAGGQEIELVMHNTDSSFGQGIGPLAHMVAYRMVQESLANAARHAPASLCEVICEEPEFAKVRIRVVNGPAQGHDVSTSESGTGFGLVGMRERADLVGAPLSYGPTEDGGWFTELIIDKDPL